MSDVFENVAFPLRVGREKHRAKEVKEMVESALALVDLSGFEGRSATQLSGGQQQRVALARAVVRRPSLLLLDEPLSNLDALLRDEMRAELKSLQTRLGLTTIYVTHDQTEALEMSDLIAVMDRGFVVQLGTPTDIYYNPATAFVATFMGSTNVLRALVENSTAAGSLGTVTLEGGRRLTCRFSADLQAGSRVAVSIRPQDVSVSIPPVARSNANLADGVIRLAGFLGHQVRYQIDVGDLILNASVASHDLLARGSPVVVAFAFEDALVLPAEPTTH